MKTQRPALARSIVAKGDAIRKLRLEAKQTQKELVRGSAVPLRTYQRAEEGKAISPETLREIAISRTLVGHTEWLYEPVPSHSTI